jgi:hypothetical protein
MDHSSNLMMPLDPPGGLHHSNSVGMPAPTYLTKGVSSSGGDFMCITCHRGPPHTKKYAKNQCQTCYKKTKKRIETPVGIVNQSPRGMIAPPSMGGYHPQYHGQMMQGVPAHMDYYYSMSQGSFNPYGAHHSQFPGGQVPGKSSSHSSDKPYLRALSHGDRLSVQKSIPNYHPPEQAEV